MDKIVKKERIYEVVRKADGLKLDCKPWMMPGKGGEYVLAYMMGINNYQGWHSIFNVYNNDDFNRDYEVIGVRTDMIPVD